MNRIMVCTFHVIILGGYVKEYSLTDFNLSVQEAEESKQGLYYHANKPFFKIVE